MKIEIKDIIFKASAMLVVAGSILPLLLHESWVPYIFAVGAAGMSVIRLITPYRGSNTRMRRLVLTELLATLMLLFASFLMFNSGYEWVVILTISALLQLYTSIAIAQETKKEKGE
jgi:phosphatidylserine synthase